MNNPQREEDQERNLFNLYNAGTEFLTHRYDKGHARGLELNGQWYGTIREMATNSTRLATLVEPVEDVAVTVTE